MKKERIHVLLVEDEEAHAELIRRSFEADSEVIQLTIARSLEEARESLAETLPDLAIVDLFLPDGRGFELLEDDVETRYPVVIMTSHGDEEVAVEAMKKGALQYVVKTEAALAELPHKVEGALRQWGHIVERKQAEEALQVSEAHFRSLIENALDIITAIDREGKVEYASPSFERILGFSRDDRTGADFLELVHPDDRPIVERHLEEALGDGTIRFSYRHRHQEGSWRYLEAIVSSYLHGDERRRVVNSRDVTEQRLAEEARQRLEDQLRHSQKWEIVANLAGDIAKEFNEMLTPILDYATITLQESPKGSKTRARLERVLTTASRARRLAEQIFIFSRRRAPQLEEIHLTELIAAELGRRQCDLPSNVDLEQYVDSECPPVLADEAQIREVLGNLWNNAAHAMREKGGTLTVQVSRVDATGDARSAMRLSVHDTGHGMDSATVARALEPFFTTKSVSDAAGLGLSVAHAIVASHGGELRVESTPGMGTTVLVDLPCA